MLRVHQVGNLIRKRLFSSAKSQLVYSESVQHALNEHLPVVALESTIITHGMPFPQNVECALECERKVRQAGATPATIAILNGKLKIGLSNNEIQEIGELKDVVKTSRRDFAYVIGKKLNGGTTVSGTLLAANLAGIPIMATGGIGGVHRNGESTMDISADLIEMGKTPIAVVSSGVKSILDIPKTLEFLETQGVFVASFSETKTFPAFYTRNSGCVAPYNVTSELEAAKIIKATRDLGLQSGMLFAVPVAEADALEEELMQLAIDEGLKLAEKRGIIGKLITPFLLEQVAKVTSGKSLRTNMKLVQNNCFVGGRIAVELCKLENKKSKTEKLEESAKLQENRSSIMVIGGSILDRCVTVLEDEIHMDGRIHDGKITESAGGVGRNIYEALAKLHQLATPPRFLSTIGDDMGGRIVSNSLPQETQLLRCPDKRTAQCVIVFDKMGECKFLVGDMSIHGELSPAVITQYRENISSAPLIVMDANMPVESMEVIFKIAHDHRIPVFFEPTDYHCSIKPFQTTNWQNVIKFITPNFNELCVIAEHLGESTAQHKNNPNRIEAAAKLAVYIRQFVPNIFVTLGHDGLIIARRNGPNDPLISEPSCDKTQVRHYPAIKCKNLVNVSGAGDCLAAGIVTAMIKGNSEMICINVGLQSAQCSLVSQSAIPQEFFNNTHECWRTNAKFETIF